MLGFLHMRRMNDDTDLRLLDLVERLAAEFESDVGTKPILDEVQRARDRLRLEHLDETENIELVESIARGALAERKSGRCPAPRHTPRQRNHGRNPD